MDSIAELGETAQEATAVLGRGEDFVLVKLSGPIPETVLEDARRRNFQFAGLLGIVGGRAVVRCEQYPGALETVLAVTFDFARQVADRIKSDGGAWFDLERLHTLPDPRSN